MNIRIANKNDTSRIAEIYGFNNRMNYYPIFKDIVYSFKDLNVYSILNNYLLKDNVLDTFYVYFDKVIKGFIQIEGNEVSKLYVDTFFQNESIGKELIKYAVDTHNVSTLWVLEKNTKAIKFYLKNGFKLTQDKKLEEGSTEYLLRLEK